MKKICKCCGKEFETNNPQKLFCDREHYLPCPVCGKPVLKTDRDFTRPPKCCSTECSHILRQRKFKKKVCVLCGEEFYPKSGCQTACDKVHYDKCEICGKLFERTVANKLDGITTCSHECTVEKLKRRSLERYGTEHPMQSKEVQKNFHDAMIKKYGVPHALQVGKIVNKQQSTAYHTNMVKNGVPYACLLPQCIEAQGKIISNVNKEFANRLKSGGIDHSFERRINNFSFDICIEGCKTLIELDPTYTHNSYMNHWGEPKDKNYHKTKSQIANDAGYRCIHIFDWDSWDKVINLLKPKTIIYGRNCTVKDINTDTANDFLTRYHIQNSCKGQTICLGLYCQDKLVEVMTFGKSRYDKSFDYELLRLCTLPDYQVIGGASKLFKHAVDTYKLNNIISYCDLSKFSGEVYSKLNMQLIRSTPPQGIWSKGTKKITANLLRARGYDQLFHTNHGKGTSNEELMLEGGWLPIYDCGQAVYAYRK